MRRKIALLLALVAACGFNSGCNTSAPSGDVVKLQGAGASFPAPLYAKWFKDFKASNANVNIDYQSVGSGQGVKSFIDGTVDFGASDAAMTADDMKKVTKGVVLLPMTAGTIVLGYNLEGVKDLKLSCEAYSGIFLGKITKWNDPILTKCNPGVQLPDKTVNVIVRSDGSGTSFVFTKHLSAINSEFKSAVGENTAPSWKVGTKAPKNDGVANAIHKTPGSIGYIEFSFAKNMTVAQLENKSGKYLSASTNSAQAALDSVEMPDDLIAWLPDPPGAEAYPIVTYTWLLCYEKYDAKKADALHKVIEYCLTKGQESSEQLGYVPLSEKVISKVKEAAKKITAEKTAQRAVPEPRVASRQAGPARRTAPRLDLPRARWLAI